MKINEIAKILKAEVLAGKSIFDSGNYNVEECAASDLMSDVLARGNTPDILMTGLSNIQVIRTAALFGINAIVIVRGKMPTEAIIEMAEDEDIILLVTSCSLFEACGVLYQTGLRGKHEYGHLED